MLVMNDTIKQNVQWFPGHMAKTRRKIKESLPLVDAVVEILDARIPRSSQNPEIAEIIGEKPHIAILNKCDIADDAATKKWLEYFRQNGIYALALDCKTGKGLNRFVPLVNEVLKDKIQSNIDKGMAGRQIRLMVVGIPNTGKSSFINKMAGKKRAEVADKAGVTRHNQWFAIGGGLELLDTPGVLWPKFEDPEVGDKLAFVGSVKDQVVDIETLAVRFLRVMRDFYPERLTERYKIENFDSEHIYEIVTIASVEVRYKGQETVIRALAYLKKLGQNNFRYHLIGGGDDSFLRKLSSDLNVSDQVIFHGSLNHEQVMDFLNDADIYIQPSKQEGLPRSLIEGMSRGLLCYGTNVAGNPELLSPEMLISRKRNNYIELAEKLPKIDRDLCKDQAQKNFAKAKRYEDPILDEKRKCLFRAFKEQIKYE